MSNSRKRSHSTSGSESSNKSMSPQDEPVDVCRLRNGLNEDCLLKIFEYLNVFDLIQLCKLDDYFQSIITKWVIGKKMINLRGLEPSCKSEIFQIFGKSMKKFIVYETDFNHFLLTIVKYCQPGTLTEIELNLKPSSDIIEARNIQLAMPFFSNLHKLSLNALNYNSLGSYDEFLKQIAQNASCLQKLQLYHVNVEGSWLKTQQMGELRELLLHQPRILSMADLRIFIRSLPKLETFFFNGKQEITNIGETLANHCPNLKSFGDAHTSNNYGQMGFTDRYNFLSTFSNLNNVTLTSYTYCGSDLYQPLVKLATKNIISKLKVVSNLENAVAFNENERKRFMQCSFAQFTSLKMMEINVRNFRLTGDLHCEFILYFASQLKNLEKLTLDSDRLTNVNVILELLPRVQTLSISNVIFKHLPVEMRKIVRTLRALRLSDDQFDQHLLHLIVNIEQWRELQVYKDLNCIMTTTIDANVKPYNHVLQSPIIS